MLKLWVFSLKKRDKPKAFSKMYGEQNLKNYQYMKFKSYG